MEGFGVYEIYEKSKRNSWDGGGTFNDALFLYQRSG